MGFSVKPFSIGPLSYTPKNFQSNEIKGSTSNFSFQQLFASGDNGLGWYLSSMEAYNLYSISDTIMDATNRIADAFMELPIKIRNRKTKDYVENHPALDLLRYTDPRFNEGQLKKELMLSYLLTGEGWPVLLGNVKYEPVGLFHYPAYAVSIAQGGDGYIQSCIASYQNVIQIFTRSLQRSFNTYVFETDEQLSQMMQIISVRRRNYLRAQSPIEGIYYQALTKYFGNLHNSNLVRNGARPPFIVSPENDIMDQNQFEMFTKEWKEGYESFSGRGKSIVSPRKIHVEKLMENTRDMDFANLMANYRQEIYAIYKIPLPLVMSDTMTLNNFGSSIGLFYDNAVLPNARYILTNLSDFILSRYKDGKDLEFCIDEKDLPALKDRLFERAAKMRTVGVFSQNQILIETGYTNMDDDALGEQVLVPSTLVPLTDPADETDYNDANPDNYDDDGNPIDSANGQGDSISTTAGGTNPKKPGKKPKVSQSLASGNAASSMGNLQVNVNVKPKS